MTERPDKIIARLLLVLMPIQTACVSHQHQPDPALLTRSLDCEIVNGSYVVVSAEDSELLAEAIFGTDDKISELTIVKTNNQVTVTGSAVTGRKLVRAFPDRFSCTNSVLKLILSDEGAGNGGSSYASDTALELFVLDESSLSLRFVDTTLAFLFIIPYYSSSDKLVIVKKQPYQSR